MLSIRNWEQRFMPFITRMKKHTSAEQMQQLAWSDDDVNMASQQFKRYVH
jgi:hypothetical protein